MEYRIELKVKNNQILKKIEDAGYESVADFCRKNDRLSWQSRIGSYINLKETPINSEGDFYAHVYEMANMLNCSPEDLFTETQMHNSVKSNKRSIEISEAEVKFALINTNDNLLLEDQLIKDRMPEKIKELLKTLTPHQEKIICMRFGIDCEPQTYEQIGSSFDVSRERIRQIEQKALRMLRHPSIHESIEEYI